MAWIQTSRWGCCCPRPAHADLAALAWAQSGHTGTASRVASFDGAGLPSDLALAAVALSGSASDLANGTLSADRLATSGVAAGTFARSTITVDNKGRVTAASAGAVPQLALAVQHNVASALTLTNQPSTLQFLAATDRHITRADLAGYTEVRLVARVTTGSASQNTPRLILRYRTAFSTNAADYLAVGNTEVTCSLASTGLITSAWQTLVSGAKADVFLAVLQEGGDGTADPALGSISVQFR